AAVLSGGAVGNDDLADEVAWSRVRRGARVRGIHGKPQLYPVGAVRRGRGAALSRSRPSGPASAPAGARGSGFEIYQRIVSRQRDTIVRNQPGSICAMAAG